MNLTILGVGKSGTTAFFEAFKKIMKDQLSGSYEFIFEPFLRDNSIDFSGDKYKEIKALTKIDSLSAEGIYNHQSLPMLITDPTPYRHSTFLRRIYGRLSYGERLAHEKKSDHRPRHVLAKFIRAAGRYKLIDTVVPDGKTIYLIRNPLDTANSIKNRFSFYGGEFHRCDEARFLREARSYYGDELIGDGSRSYIDSQLFYWYHMNRFALESFSELKNRPYIVCYDTFFSNLEAQLLSLLCYLGLEFRPHYLDYFREIYGPITSKKELHPLDFDVALSYLEPFQVLLNSFGITSEADLSKLARSYDNASLSQAKKNRYYGLTARHIAKTMSRDFEEVKKGGGGPAQFLHVINPASVPVDSDLHTAQPITFQSMKAAKDFASLNGVSVSQCAAFFEEDESIVPSAMEKCKPLKSSCLDVADLSPRRKLPFIGEILDRAAQIGGAKYIVYTNVDIALMPHFYLTAESIMRSGYDAITICRRTLSVDCDTVEGLPVMYSDMGADHPGTDCFIFKADLLQKFDLQKIVIGAEFVAFALRVNLHLFASSIMEFKRLHMTFHIGDDRSWSSQSEYAAFNSRQVRAMFLALEERNDLRHPEKLSAFSKQFDDRMQKKWGKILA